MTNFDKKKGPSAFLRNLYNILNNTEFDQIVAWVEEGNGFVIKDLPEFELSILPRYFKHKKYSSFVRQVTQCLIKLNMYCFHKQRNSAFENCFLHDQFRKGNEKPAEIKRKPEKKKKLLVEQEVSRHVGENWLDVGKELFRICPHVLENGFEKDQNKKTSLIKPIILSSKLESNQLNNCMEEELLKNQNQNHHLHHVNDQQERVLLEKNNNNIEAEAHDHASFSEEEDEEYISKISLKGIDFESEILGNEKIMNIKKDIKEKDVEEIIQEEKENPENEERHHYSVEQSDEELKKETFNNHHHEEHHHVNEQQEEQTFLQQPPQPPQHYEVLEKPPSSPLINKKSHYLNHHYRHPEIHEGTLTSWSAISEILIMQNEILQSSHSVIKETVLNSQRNKIAYLKEEMKALEEDTGTGTHEPSSSHYVNLAEIINKEKSDLQKLSEKLSEQIHRLSHMSQEDNPISTTSIHLGLEKRQQQQQQFDENE